MTNTSDTKDNATAAQPILIAVVLQIGQPRAQPLVRGRHQHRIAGDLCRLHHAGSRHVETAGMPSVARTPPPVTIRWGAVGAMDLDAW